MKRSITPISSDQVGQIVRVIEDAARKSGREVVEELAKTGVLHKDNLQQVLGMKGFAASIRDFVKQKLAELAENIAGYVKLISGAETIELDETDGGATIAKADMVFKGGIYHYGCSEKDTNVPSQSTKKAKATVHEMIRDGTFAQIWNGMSDDLNSLCLTQPQIIQFVQKHRKWLRTDGYGTFFLFKVGEEFFVARVYFDVGGQLRVSVLGLSYGDVWYAGGRPRIVVPQLVLAN